ncbi:hypothetical protein [Pseudomonas psychrophila]|uniref:hypothetical protein n=1 Tax=Pseudomonas psychrophila TaxID=122355 RepID=UPI0012FD1687|nr:hypothetical protein [Pseudomonas psychrophila]
MKKLFKLKKWLTLEETARRLSSVADEEVSPADVLRLALDGHLTISADFVNHARGKLWERVPLESARTFTSDGSHFPDSQPYTVLIGVLLNEEEVLQPVVQYGDQEPLVMHGVFDLTMWGAEELDIEHFYQKLTDGPDIALMNLEGPFLRGDDGQIYQLLESFDQNEHSSGSLAHLRSLEDHIAAEGIEPEKAKKIREWHSNQRVQFSERMKANKKIDNYYPASRLPSDCRLVVRNEAIRQLEDQLLKDESVSAPISPNDPKPSHFLTISALLGMLEEPVKNARPNGLKQSGIKDAILERWEGRGLSKRTLDSIFSAANKAGKIRE